MRADKFFTNDEQERIRQAVRNLPGVLEVTRRMAGTTKAGEELF